MEKKERGKGADEATATRTLSFDRRHDTPAMFSQHVTSAPALSCRPATRNATLAERSECLA
jgi:hypothetical protein